MIKRPSGNKHLTSLIIITLFAAFSLIELAQLSRSSVSANSQTTDEFKVTTVFIVRHAERASKPPEDPVLTEEGKTRAEKLSQVLQSVGIKAIYTSQFARTKLTAEPLAGRLGIASLEVPVRMDQANPRMVSEQSIRDLVEKIYARPGDSALIVGHSNTVPEVIKMLGGDLVPTLGERDYDDLFVVTVYARGKSKVARLKYGEPSQP